MLLALYYPGFYWGAQREVGWHEGPLLSFVCFLCFSVLFFSFLLLVIVTFLRFVVSSSPIRITLECKQIVPFSPHPSPLSALSLFHPGNFSRVTSCDSVWPMKSSLHASYVSKGVEAEALQRRESVQFREELSKLLAVFISLAVMGWFNLLTKRFLMPNCDDMEAKMASTWLHFRCKIPEV